MRKRHLSLSLLVLACSVVLSIGCTRDQVAAPSEPADTAAEEVNDHSGWWCIEHHVPEGECTRCNSTLVAEFKQSGDWCEEHERPDSQCFHCNPELEQKYAAKYEAKYGKTPPKPTDP